MKNLQAKRIIVGIAGGIAAYKSADLVRRLQEAGASVKVVMTTAATAFITPLTLQAVSGQPVHLDLLDPAAEGAMGHIELARWADLILIAPATADIIARIATGQGDDLLTTLCLARPGKTPLALAPAMNKEMWIDPATQANIEVLKGRSVIVWGPGVGEQACGDVGAGRMLEPLELANWAHELFANQLLAGQRVFITAGATREPIDPVRFISNRSSGKMGFAMAQAAREAGASVSLICGPNHLPTPAGVNRIDIETAQEMYEAVFRDIKECDIFIGCAAVADYRCAEVPTQKLKRSAQNLVLELIPNPDIVANVAALENKPFTVGFAAETHAILEHGRAKLIQKNLDAIIVNEVGRAGQGFDSEDNAVTLLWPVGEQSFALRSKSQLARQLITAIAELRTKE